MPVNPAPPLECGNRSGTNATRPSGLSLGAITCQLAAHSNTVTTTMRKIKERSKYENKDRSSPFTLQPRHPRQPTAASYMGILTIIASMVFTWGLGRCACQHTWGTASSPYTWIVGSKARRPYHVSLPRQRSNRSSLSEQLYGWFRVGQALITRTRDSIPEAPNSHYGGTTPSRTTLK